jgi:hypothetical protein
MSEDYSVCAICDVKFTRESEPDAHYDDSGDYHYDCHRDASDKDARYWAGLYYAEKPDPLKLTAQEQLDAYEVGSAKRYSMERELIGY